MARRWKNRVEIGVANLLGGLILAWLPLLAPAAPASHDLPAAVDLRLEAAAAARRGGPLVIVFSRKDCAYCRTVKRDYLQPLAAQPRYRERLLVRQVDQDSDAPLTDFAGRPTTHAAFAAAARVRLVPVVAFYGPAGKPLAEPIVGARLADFYQSDLEAAIDQSALALAKK